MVAQILGRPFPPLRCSLDDPGPQPSPPRRAPPEVVLLQREPLPAPFAAVPFPQWTSA